MTIFFRGPSGKSYAIDSADSDFSIDCSKPADAAGQWFVYSTSRETRLVFGIQNGRPLERLGDSLAFQSSLDEAGEEFVAVLHSRNLLLVRLSLTTKKLSLEGYYQLLNEHLRLLGVPPRGASCIAGTDSITLRSPTGDERAYRLVRSAFELLRTCRTIRPDLTKHPRGQVGQSGIDSLRTLDSWKRHRSWYRVAEVEAISSIRCGPALYVEPLRTRPRPSTGGNKFLGAIDRSIASLLTSLPQNPAGQITAGLLHASKRSLAALDVAAPVSEVDSQIILDTRRLPTRSARLVEILRATAVIAKENWETGFAPEGELPFSLPETELVFQRTAVAAMLYALGVPLCSVASAYREASTINGANIEGNYLAWVDTPLHGLKGWREDSNLPSGYRPDLVVQRRHDSRWLLVDAKLRQGDSGLGLMSQSGIKDLQAYMHEYRLEYGVLLVPGGNRYSLDFEDVEGRGCHIRSIAIPSSGLVDNVEDVIPLLEGMWN
jgi:hypothetical protein